ncbi:MAG: hypothetical protein A2X32_03000 [Elusimicrobia bacterium GWC2_64_44]|nr:MAG: hypothetical protein A2X32_03000 [Elusimicrobia bacterium GWC2_64_44]
MKTFKARITKILMALLLLPAIAAAAPSQINYQGRLVDATGNPLSGSYTLTFRIYDAASAGTTLWTEPQTLTVDNGIFSAKLGSVANLPPSVFSADTRYLGVTVGADAEMTPRVQLLSVPYAIYAASAASVGTPGQGVIISTFVQVNDYISATRFIGDGSGLTGISAGGSSIVLPIVSTHIADGSIANADLAGSIAYNKLTLTGAILNADLAGSIAYNKLALTGAILNADLAGSIADSKLNTITTAGKVDGAAVTGLASLPAGAGLIPAANLPATVSYLGSDISSAEIADGTIADGDLAASGFNLSKFTVGQINTDLVAGTLVSTHIADGSIANADLAGSIAYNKLALTGAVLNADLAGSIAYNKLALTGAILNADLAGSIADSKLSAITTAGKVDGSAVTGLANLPAGAGLIPAANLPATVSYLGSDISSAEIADGTIANGDLAASGFDLAKFTVGQISTDLIPATIVSTHIADGSIANADLAGSIAYNKLALTGAILDADLAGSIAYSKLSLTGAILNADLAGSIADSKLSAITTAGKVDGSAVTGLANLPAGAGLIPAANLPATVSYLGSDITNAEVAAAAGIVYSKLDLSNSIVAGDLTAGAVTKAKLAVEGCADGKILKLAGGAWTCDDDAGAGGSVAGTGAAGRVAFWTGAAAIGSNANIFWDDTNSYLGINDTTPGQALDVTGNINVTGNVVAANVSGNGSGLTALNAANLGSGTVDDARLSANVTLLGATIDAGELPADGYAATYVNAAEGDSVTTGMITNGTILNADLSASGFDLGKFSAGTLGTEFIGGTIVSTHIAANAAIPDTKLATIATAGKVSDTALSANVTLLGATIDAGELPADGYAATYVNAAEADSVTSAMITNGEIVDADIAAGAAIVLSKLATTGSLGAAVTHKAGAGTGEAAPIGTLSVNTGTQATLDTAGEEVLMSFSVPADSFNGNGKAVKIKAWGTTAANANSKTIKIRFGGLAGDVVLTTTTFANAQAWDLEATVVRTGVGTQESIARGYVGEFVVPVAKNTPAQDETGAVSVAVTGDTATAAGDVVAEGLIVEFVN